jgi:hypothetical protein
MPPWHAARARLRVIRYPLLRSATTRSNRSLHCKASPRRHTGPRKAPGKRCRHVLKYLQALC